jgi:tripartite motif-containing protein 71
MMFRRTAALMTVSLLAAVAAMTAVAPVSATSSPTFLATLAGPSIANMYSSGVEWDTIDNRIVVADTGNNQIELYSPGSSGRCATCQFGTFGSGNGMLNSPRDVAVDGTGNIYVADAGNNRVQKFDSSGNFLWASPGNPSSACVFSQAKSTCLNSPIGVTWDATNNVLLVADTGDSLIKAFDGNGNWIWTSPAGKTLLGVTTPRDVTRGPGGYIWVSAYAQNQIKAFQVTSSGVWTQSPTVVLGDGTTGGHGSNQLNFPYNIAFSPDGQIGYVSDIGNDRIAIYNLSDLTNPQWLGQYGKRCSQPCPSPVPSGKFAFLRRVAVETNGDVIGDDFWGNGMFVYPPSAIPFNAQPPIYQIEGYHAPAPGFAQAFGVAVGSDGTTYGVDRLNQRVERFDSGGNFLNTSGVRGSTNPDSFSWPEDVAVAPDSTVWIADTRNSRLQHWPANLALPSPYPDIGTKGAGLGQFNYPEGLTLDSNGMVWVADTNNNRIQSYDPTDGRFTVYGSSGNASCQFNHPQAVAASPSGVVYVADTSNNRIVEMDVSGGLCNSFLNIYSASLSGPQGVALAGDGSVWVADSGNNAVVHLSASLSNLGNGFGGPGTGNYAFNDPHSLAIFGTTLFVADTYNNRVQEYSIRRK